MANSSLPVVLRSDAELNMGGNWPKQAQQLCRFVTAPDDRVETLVRLVPEASILFTCYAPITAEVIAAGKQLRGIVKYGVGVDSIDLEAAADQGIPVVHCPEYGTDTVADHAFALMIGLARKLPTIDQGMRSQGWLWPEEEFCGVDLAGKTLGIIGYGRIGKAMARRGLGFGMRCLVYDPYVPQDDEIGAELVFTPLQRVLQEADFLSLHCVLTDETRGIIDAAALRQMKDSAIVVNVSRGALIDQAALFEAIDTGQIAAVGLDVFPSEPLDLNHPLARSDKALLTPHLAFYTREAYERLEHQCYTATTELLNGRLPGPPLFVKNGAALQQRGHNVDIATTSHQPPSGDTSSTRSANNEPANAADAITNDATLADATPNDADAWRLAEGDINRSPHREAWQSHHLDAAEKE
ncbi:MAG: 2-hydroxyacid dehydrogenase, partial [Bythopirellula sp.]